MNEPLHSNLVNRLREARAALDGTGITQFDNTLSGGSLYLKAADEIERLTSDFQQVHHNCIHARAVADKALELLNAVRLDHMSADWRRALVEVRELAKSVPPVETTGDGCRYPMSYGARCAKYPDCVCGRESPVNAPAQEHYGRGDCGCSRCDWFRKHPQCRPPEKTSTEQRAAIELLKEMVNLAEIGDADEHESWHAVLKEARELISRWAAPRSFQDRVFDWARDCFGERDTTSREMRTDRFLEEALELAQACGCPKDRATRVLAYVYGRPAGEVAQETGGTMVSLAVLCQAFGIGMNRCAEAELTRVLGKVDHIRARHAAKPDFAVEVADGISIPCENCHAHVRLPYVGAGRDQVLVTPANGWELYPRRLCPKCVDKGNKNANP